MSKFDYRVETQKNGTITIYFTIPKYQHIFLPNWPNYLIGYIKYDKIDETKYNVSNLSKTIDITVFRAMFENPQPGILEPHNIIRDVVKSVKRTVKDSQEEQRKINDGYCSVLLFGISIGLIIGFLILYFGGSKMCKNK
jgi:hypothetical protein